ncbi:hypothetical protein AVEN_205212-1 [Araneus ventricosus]|uniref:Uncharacterized protein n=1 Tax=Araneus ventricosus TaxID=182803 RepID=A0A4Y2G317_ARAVE|nr:hypothetical protein AVEN_205212-1 [Araneus ventricosus]
MRFSARIHRNGSYNASSTCPNSSQCNASSSARIHRNGSYNASSTVPEFIAMRTIMRHPQNPELIAMGDIMYIHSVRIYRNGACGRYPVPESLHVLGNQWEL